MRRGQEARQSVRWWKLFFCGAGAAGGVNSEPRDERKRAVSELGQGVKGNCILGG